ncbi:hypothetical protein ACS3UN_10360 [Oscillospiraceae bacterium LTW-04]|nr:hypothetical protein RBH76_12110 [Oscillospiraceae bacterium MB24-C1]
MKNLEGFLNPKKKPNLRFILSEDFVGEDGAPLVWEMRTLSARELCEVRGYYEGRGQEETTLALLHHYWLAVWRWRVSAQWLTRRIKTIRQKKRPKRPMILSPKNQLWTQLP